MKKLLLISITLFAVNSLANDAGCGLGSMIISKNSKLLQLFAATTNSSFLTQAFGITSGTSGCSASGLVSNDKQIEYFVEVNQEDLSRQMAQGRGEKLEVLAQLNGCKTQSSQMAFAEMTQKSYERILPSVDTKPTEFVQNLKQQLSENQEVSSLCVASL